MDSRKLVLVGHGFFSKEDAHREGLRCQTALKFALARQNIGADFGDGTEEGGFGAYAIDKIQKEFGVTLINNRKGLMTYETDCKPQFVVTSCAGMLVTKDPLLFKRLFATASGYNTVLSFSEELAFTFFNMSFFAITCESQFLLLMMSVESLIKRESRVESSRTLIDSLVSATKECKTISEEDRQALVNALGNLKKESISQAGRRLCLERLEYRVYEGKASPIFFAHCYNLRSKLVHGSLSSPDSMELKLCAGSLRLLVCDLLTLKTFGRAPDLP